MHITLRGLRFVDVGIIYPILGKVLFQITFTNYGNILAHNTALVTRGNSGLACLNSSRKSLDIPLPTQSPILVNPMGPITQVSARNATAWQPRWQLANQQHKTCFHWMHVLTTQAQVTASGIFPWSDWLTWSTLSVDRYSCQRNSFSAECTYRLHSARTATQWSAWRCAARTLVDM